MELTKEIWTQSDYDEFAEYLKTLADEKYKKFSDSLVPGGTQSIGIRVPILRQTAKAISKGDYASFLNCKNNAYREEIMIKGLVMSLIKCDYHEMLGYIKQYVPQITSWETCDIVSFKGLKKHMYDNNHFALHFQKCLLQVLFLSDSLMQTPSPSESQH